MKAHTSETQATITPARALEFLKEGNVRFINNLRVNRNLLQQANETRDGQWPFATVVSCIDSRTSSELIFDQGLGDIFSVRIAGTVVNTDVIGSLEFACKLAGSRLIVVLGHTGAERSGARATTWRWVTSPCCCRRSNPRSTKSSQTQDVAERTARNPKFVENVADLNVRRSVKTIVNRSLILEQLIESKELAIIGAKHDLGTGRVEFFDDTWISDRHTLQAVVKGEADGHRQRRCSARTETGTRPRESRRPRRARCPDLRRVMAMSPFTSILCAVDFSTLAPRVLRHAVGLAGACGARLAVITVTDADRRDAEARVLSMLRDVVPPGASYMATPDIQVVYVALGSPADAILSRARDGVDLIVAGTHSKSGLSRWLLGSTSAAIMEEACVRLSSSRPETRDRQPDLQHRHAAPRHGVGGCRSRRAQRPTTGSRQPVGLDRAPASGVDDSRRRSDRRTGGRRSLACSSGDARTRTRGSLHRPAGTGGRSD